MELFQSLSPSGQNLLVKLAGRTVEFRAIVRGATPSKPEGWDDHAWLMDLLNQIENLQTNPGLSGAGPGVAPEEADQSGLLLRLEVGGKVQAVTLPQALNMMSGGAVVLIGGAGSPLGDFVQNAFDFAYAQQTPTLLVQYLGVDFSHYSSAGSLPDLAAKLEVNLVKTAVLECANAALNACGRTSLVVSYGLGAWVVNRALRALPAAQIPFARNLQINGFGPEDAIAELAEAKLGLFGRICSVQGEADASDAETLFKLSPGTLRKMPVDVHIPAAGA